MVNSSRNENCLIDYCGQRDEGCPAVLLYVTKNAMVHRATRQRPNQWQYYFLSEIHAISASEVEIPKEERRPRAGKKVAIDIIEVDGHVADDSSDGVDVRVSEFYFLLPLVTYLAQPFHLVHWN